MMNNKHAYLKFIGKDGSMGLCYGKNYEVSLYTRNCRLIALVRKNSFSNVICPYDTLIGFSKNWEVAK